MDLVLKCTVCMMSNTPSTTIKSAYLFILVTSFQSPSVNGPTCTIVRLKPNVHLNLGQEYVGHFSSRPSYWQVKQTAQQPINVGITADKSRLCQIIVQRTRQSDRNPVAPLSALIHLARTRCFNEATLYTRVSSCNKDPF